ncbi:peptide chain release factor 2 [Paucidesulfovibrio gracilis DSM 16080]|uniref:Peptide chain release factor 2 n=1 Tax=Paucidesulfovibrio gracilis DSM 16080 TaxID=1121449 RepID=A0A1T4WM67_9BACT|nr:peptide chain release factor 2 [Paucidesulfovibrio gracilis DSM 16080]
MLREKSQLEHRIAIYDKLFADKEDVEVWLELAGEDEDSLDDLFRSLTTFEKNLESTEMATLLSGEQDGSNAILEIHPGAGGVESQDWAEMLVRMYSRWAEDRGFSLKLLDMQHADEAGIKSATLQIEGPYAYGYLHGEAGIHRLIRISPFDASGRRHTSFASVDVYPDVDEDIEIEVREEDLRVDVYRASGPGGQHVNKTNSAVRITHLPTNIVVQCQNEKSQLRNRQTAMKLLKARLYEREMKIREESQRVDYASKEAINFGSQIRTYTLQPYRLVKDHRSNTEDGNVDAVLDGALDRLMRSYLLYAHAGKQKAS